MATEKKHGKKVETHLALTTHAKFKKKCEKNGTSMAQLIRDLIQLYNKQ